MQSEIELRFIGEDEFRPYLNVMGRGFGDWPLDDETFEAMKPPLHRGYALAACDKSGIVGTFVSNPMKMIVPECQLVPVSAISGVAVLPTHRRRGILTRMMECQLRRAYEEGHALAILEASESIIYGRYGFGVATHSEMWAIDRHRTALVNSPASRGSVRFIEKDDVLSLLPPVVKRSYGTRSGFVQVWPEHWAELLGDLEINRRGGGPLNFAVYEEDGRTDGYVIYRLRDRTVVVLDLMAATPDAYITLWQFVFGIDLRTRIEAANRPVDDPLPWMLADRRRLERRRTDSMWLRILDVERALEQRDYAKKGRIVIEIRDEFCPWNEGRYELDVGDEGARCRRTNAAPDVVLPSDAMASMYLGDTRLSTLIRGMRAEANTQEVVGLADTMFRSSQIPFWPHPL